MGDNYFLKTIMYDSPEFTIKKPYREFLIENIHGAGKQTIDILYTLVGLDPYDTEVPDQIVNMRLSNLGRFKDRSIQQNNWYPDILAQDVGLKLNLPNLRGIDINVAIRKIWRAESNHENLDRKHLKYILNNLPAFNALAVGDIRTTPEKMPPGMIEGPGNYLEEWYASFETPPEN